MVAQNDPPPNRRSYVRALLSAFRRLPDTLPRHRRGDVLFAESLNDEGVPLSVVYVAFVLATARRSVPRHILPDLSDHPPILSLRYFRAVIDEVRNDPAVTEPSYLGYLVHRNARYGRALPLIDQLFVPKGHPGLPSRARSAQECGERPRAAYTKLALPL